MKKLSHAQLTVFIFGLVFVALAFVIAAISPVSHESLMSSSDATLPQGVHIPININTADIDTLCLLENIGETRAQSIIDYRNTEGCFEAKEDIMNVYGIGEKTFAKIENYICTN